LEKPKKPISAYTDPAEVRQIMANAKRLGNDDLYWEAFRKVCQLEGKNFEDPLERDFYSMLAAYEELLYAKHGKRIRATRVRDKLQRKGFLACLEDWAVGSKRTEGFTTLVSSGHVELTGEFLVSKYPDRFTPKAVRNARMVLDMVENAELAK
jgi:hypothetical protein